MRHIRLHYTGAAFFFLLFSATGAEPYSLLKVLEGLQAEPQNYPSPLYSFALCMEINNRVFSDVLFNSSSQQYKRMYAEVAGALDIAFNCSDCDTRETYRGVTNIRFSNGSVIANCTIQFQTIFINHVVIKHLFLRAVDNNTQLNGLSVNRQYTAEIVTPIWLFPKSSTPMAETSVQGLPGWAIALLVLACIIILLLFIILLLICFWCCRRKEKKEETQTVTPYERTSFKEHLANPTYMSHTPEKSPNYRSLLFSYKDWSGVDYLWIIVMFLSAVWTLILTAPIHCRASTGRTGSTTWQPIRDLHESSEMKTTTPLTIRERHGVTDAMKSQDGTAVSLIEDAGF